MFRGRYEHTIDAKGRLSIPSKFREILAAEYDNRLVITTYDGCLLVYPNTEWKKLEDEIAKLPQFNKDTRAFLRFFYSSAADCPIDKLGRVLIPQTLKNAAKLEKDIVILGTFKRMEIWSKYEWSSREGEASSDEIGNMLERLGL